MFAVAWQDPLMQPGTGEDDVMETLSAMDICEASRQVRTENKDSAYIFYLRKTPSCIQQCFNAFTFHVCIDLDYKKILLVWGVLRAKFILKGTLIQTCI